MSQFAISHIERGRKLPSVDALWRIASALRVPASRLLEETTPAPDAVAADLARHLHCLGHTVDTERRVAGTTVPVAIPKDHVAVLPSDGVRFDESPDELAAHVGALIGAKWSAILILHGGHIDLHGVGRAVNLWALASRARSLAGSYILLGPDGRVRQDSNRKLRCLSTEHRASAIPGQA